MVATIIAATMRKIRLYKVWSVSVMKMATETSTWHRMLQKEQLAAKGINIEWTNISHTIRKRDPVATDHAVNWQMQDVACKVL